MISIFGIKQCSTMQKVFGWFSARNLEYTFFDYKRAAPEVSLLQGWVHKTGWERLLNTRGTTWRKLTEAERDGVDEAKAIQLMTQYPSLIKRPVIVSGEKILVGFDEKALLDLTGVQP